MKTTLLAPSPHFPTTGLSRKTWLVFLLLSAVFLPHKLLADSGINQAFIILNAKNTRSIFYDLNPQTDTPNTDFTGLNFGSFSTDETFILKGAEAKTYKNGGCDVINARIKYLVYPAGNRAGTPICDLGLPFGRDIGNGDQIWVYDQGNVDLVRGQQPGSYVIEVYIESDYQGCGTGTNYYSNNGANYVAFFTITQGDTRVDPSTASCPRPLPVTLTRFDAKRQGANTLLSWETASESNSRGYEVQVSTDARTFRALGFVPSQTEGSEMSRRTYTYVDNEDGKTGVRYYRLRQIDFDGKEGIYGPQVISFGKAGALAALIAAPNPFSSEVTLTLPAQESTRSGTVVVTDMLGRTVFNQPLLLDAGTSQVQLPELSSLPKGLYHLRLSLNGEQQALKLLKE
ncbi:T9SS type A sorting domain-containing protein [uncultured Hymenobacter sp.]|uniref:T9SS type A sorting domain-containing protein n=1 Tax=uncultured Hymenobacter sp. TaxID=170016 RepID=UPI0035CA93C9